MGGFIDTLSYVAWAVLIGIGLLSAIIFVVKDTKNRLKTAKVNSKLDAWLEKVFGLINLDRDGRIDDLEQALTKLESGSLDSKLCNNEEFFYLTEAIMFSIMYKRVKPIQNERFANAKELVINAVKKFYFYMTRQKGYFKMEPKIYLRTKMKNGFDSD